MKKIAIALLFMSGMFVANAQDMDVETIIKNYTENIGGEEAWSAVVGVEMEAKISMQGMEIPLTMTQLKDGRTATVASFQGMTFYQGMFDGEVLWGTNQMTMEAEKSESEDTENLKRNVGEFPGDLLTYDELGYTCEMDGEDTKEGVECYKLKMTKKNQIIDGEEVEQVIYYFMDKESFIPIMQEQEIHAGPMKGNVSQTVFSDYQEVDGLYFPFSLTQQVEGMGGQEIVIESVVINPEVKDELFNFPE